MPEARVIVHIVYHPGGFFIGCRKCQRPLATGEFVIALHIGEYRYLVGPTKDVHCCGEAKDIFQAFATEDEAEAAKDYILRVLERDRSTTNLKLVELTRLSPSHDEGGN